MIEPYGGALIDLRDADEDLRRRAAHLPSVRISERSVCDLEMLATGGFSPLRGFMDRHDFRRVLEEMRLADGTIFPVPVVLPVEPSAQLSLDAEVALHDSHNDLLAVMEIGDAFPWDVADVARHVLRTSDPRHPLVAEMTRWGRVLLSGRLRVLRLPGHPDFRDLRMEPRQVRSRLAELGHEHVVAFQTRNPLHRAHEEVTRRAAEAVDGTLLLHPVVGLTRPGDVDHYTRVRSYRALVSQRYDPQRVLLSLAPFAMWMAGPREALWHAIIRRNYGADHFIVGRDHASPGVDSEGRPFYGPYDAQQLLEAYAPEIGVAPVPLAEMQYLPDEERYEEATRVPGGARAWSLSATRMRDDLEAGRRPPEWVVRPEVVDVLATAYPPRHRQGVCVWFTGLSGAGKSTTADLLTVLLLERGRQVTVLDGDVVRTHLSKGLGFSREDRDTNVRRIGFVASEIVRHGGVALCAAVSPYRATRNDVRMLVGGDRFVEVFVDAPLEVCEARDTKGMYARARRGEVRHFTGIDDPYEAPQHPEIVLDAAGATAEDNARRIVGWLEERGFVVGDGG